MVNWCKSLRTHRRYFFFFLNLRCFTELALAIRALVFLLYWRDSQKQPHTRILFRTCLTTITIAQEYKSTNQVVYHLTNFATTMPACWFNTPKTGVHSKW
uniref:Putative secreted protein n=1 Tax=Rhipicephalus microplus TaxID=6941 RepID=A0A6G5A423_RHIMP